MTNSNHVAIPQKITQTPQKQPLSNSIDSISSDDVLKQMRFNNPEFKMLAECTTTAQFMSLLSTIHSSSSDFRIFSMIYKPFLIRYELEINKDYVTLKQSENVLAQMDSRLLSFQQFIGFIKVLKEAGCMLGAVNVNYYHKSESMRDLLIFCCENLNINDENLYSDVLLFGKLQNEVQIKQIMVPLTLSVVLLDSIKPLNKISHLTICFNDENNEISDAGINKFCKDLQNWSKIKANFEQRKSLTIKAKSSLFFRRSIGKLLTIKTFGNLGMEFQLEDFTLPELIELYPIKDYITRLSLVRIDDYALLSSKLEVFSFLEEISYNFIRTTDSIVVGHSNARRMILTTTNATVESTCFTKETKLQHLQVNSGNLVFFGGDIHSELVSLCMTCKDGSDPIILGESLEQCSLNLNFYIEHQQLRQVVNSYELTKLKSLSMKIRLKGIIDKKLTIDPFEKFISHLPEGLINLAFEILTTPMSKADPDFGSDLQHLSFTKFVHVQKFEFIIESVEHNEDQICLSLPLFDLNNLPRRLTQLKLKVPSKSYTNRFPESLKELDLNLELLENPVNEFWINKISNLPVSILKITFPYCTKLDVSPLLLKTVISFTLQISQHGIPVESPSNILTELEIPAIFPDKLIEFKINSAVPGNRIYLRSSAFTKDTERILVSPEEQFIWVIGKSLNTYSKELPSLNEGGQLDPALKKRKLGDEDSNKLSTEIPKDNEQAIDSSKDVPKDLIKYFHTTYSSKSLLST